MSVHRRPVEALTPVRRQETPVRDLLRAARAAHHRSRAELRAGLIGALAGGTVGACITALTCYVL
jgi:hypothetical protein